MKSQNGWPASKNKKSIGIKNYIIPGAKRHISCAEAVAPILVEFARWFHKNIEPIDVGQYDDWGYATPVPIPGTSIISNHGSGTAEDLNSIKHRWLARKSGFTLRQEILIKRKCKKLGIRWGWTYKTHKDPMHYEIIETPAEVACRIIKLKLPMPKEGTVK